MNINRNLIAFSGKTQSGKDTAVKIWKLLDIYNNKINPKEIESIKQLEQTGLNPESYFVLKFLKLNSDEKINSMTTWEKKSFAEKLKKIIALLTGCQLSDFESNDFKNSKLPEQWTCVKLIRKDKTYKLINTNNYLPNNHDFIKQFDFTDVIEKYIPTYREALQIIGTDLFRDKFHPDTWVISTLNDFNENSKWLFSDLRFPNEADFINERGGILIRINRPNLQQQNTINQHESEIALDNYQDFNYIINNDGSLQDLIHAIKNIMIELNYIKNKIK
jgi:hypothetical protein